MIKHTLFALALFAAPAAMACPAADAAAFAAAAEKVEASTGDKLTIVVTGMHCGDCSEKVTAALSAVPGVIAAASDYQTGRTEIAYDKKKTDADALMAAIKKAGFDSSVKQG